MKINYHNGQKVGKKKKDREKKKGHRKNRQEKYEEKPNLGDLCRGDPYENERANQPQTCFVPPTHYSINCQTPEIWIFDQIYQLGIPDFTSKQTYF